jgi:hypothetical protein
MLPQHGALPNDGQPTQVVNFFQVPNLTQRNIEALGGLLNPGSQALENLTVPRPLTLPAAVNAERRPSVVFSSAFINAFIQRQQRGQAPVLPTWFFLLALARRQGAAAPNPPFVEVTEQLQPTQVRVGNLPSEQPVVENVPLTVPSNVDAVPTPPPAAVAPSTDANTDEADETVNQGSTNYTSYISHGAMALGIGAFLFGVLRRK